MKNWFKQTNNLFIGLLALCLPWSGCKTAKESPNIGVVATEDLIQRVTVPGLITANRKTVISAPYNGYIKKIYVRVGQKVKEGEPVISVVQSLRNRSEDVYPLRAPFTGTVTQILKTEGEYVEQSGGSSGGKGGAVGGNAMLRIDDLSQLLVEATVPEIEIDKLKEGQEVLIKANALLGRTYEGKIRNIFRSAKEQGEWDRSKIEFIVTIEVTRGDAHLKPGMSVIVDIIANKVSQVLTLRHEFVQKEGDEYFVKMEKGEKRKIKIGQQNDELVEIREGLREGDTVQQTDFLSLFKEQ